MTPLRAQPGPAHTPVSAASGAPIVVAVIPARGGSKGIPEKNLQRVGGVPLVSRAVASALRARRISAVAVSTDHRGIADAARAAGARVIERPAELSADTSSSEAALLHALGALEPKPDILVFIQATSPFIDPDDLDAAIARVVDGEHDVVFSARRTHAFLWRETVAGAEGINHDRSVRLRRQDSAPQFQETGAFYVMRTAGFERAGHRFFGSVGIAEVPAATAVDIDSVDDLEAARALAHLTESTEAITVDALVTDFDGVHTDDRVHLTADGTEYVTASRSDGLGVERLRRAGIPVLILSKETNGVVAARARKLGVESLQAVDEKAPALRAWAAERGIPLERVAYLGNDINDLSCLELVGWPVAVADAHPSVIRAARIVLGARGGHGAVRELADRILLSTPSTIPNPAPNLEEQWSPSARIR